MKLPRPDDQLAGGLRPYLPIAVAALACLLMAATVAPLERVRAGAA